MTRKVPVLVASKALSWPEYLRLDPQLKIDLEKSTIELIKRYGVGFMLRERRRLRAELSFFYGVSLDDDDDDDEGKEVRRDGEAGSTKRQGA